MADESVAFPNGARAAVPGGVPEGNAPVVWTPAAVGRMPAVRFAAVLIQFALLVAVIRVFNVETKAFEKVATLLLAGFVVHHFIPLRFRMASFGLLSLASVGLIFPPAAAAWLVGLGAVLIGLCHLPVAFSLRVALLCALGAALALARTQTGLPEWLARSLPAAIWPILGSMFMFRLIVYLYDLKHRAAPFDPWRAVSYFFMAPNVCFPMFPVVDYKTFSRNHYSEDVYRTYQVGLSWILRGVVHLLLYRVIYQRFVIDPGAATDAGDVAQYMLTSFLLYLRISGSYHMIVGFLHMFGFNLPRTHYLWLLSSSWGDFWRRANIYWKNFMMKVVFYPIYFKLRTPFGDARAKVLAILMVFVATWLLHSYQWFWIRGAFPITWNDAVFWGLVAVAVLVEMRKELWPGTSQSPKEPVGTVRSEVGLVLRTAATFVSVLVLWTILNTHSTLELGRLWAAAWNMSLGQAALIVLVPLAVGLTAAVIGRAARERKQGSRAVSAENHLFWASVLRIGGAGAVVLVVGAGPVESRLGPVASKAVSGVKKNTLNAGDTRELERGYYEDLGNAVNFNGALWQLYGERPKGWDDDPALRRRDDIIGWELTPSMRVPFKNATLITNSLGMRDREYAAAKPPGVFRTVLVGASIDMGAGVENNETYENLVEDRLNAERVGGSRYEILNLSVSGYTPFHKLAAIEERAFALEADLVLYVAHGGEFDWAGRRINRTLQIGAPIPYDFLVHTLTKAGVHRSDSEEVIRRRLQPYGRDLVRGVLGRLGEQCRAHRTRCALVVVDKTSDEERPPTVDELTAIARQAGLEVVDLWGAYDGMRSGQSLWITDFDNHPNARGHQLLAARLYDGLVGQGLVGHDGALPQQSGAQADRIGPR